MVELNKEDKELAEIFSGEERELHPDTVHVTLGQPKKAISKKETTTQKAKDKPVEAQWELSKERNWMDNLRDTAKWVIGFGGLSFLLFYWEMAGLMAESVAVPCMCLCTALAGVGIGKYAR
jgi:hypothetical protein